MKQFRLAEHALIARGAIRQKLGDEEILYHELNGLRLNFIPTYIELDNDEARVAIGVIGDLPGLSAVAHKITQIGKSDWHTIYRDRWTEILSENSITPEKIELELDTLFYNIEQVDQQSIQMRCFNENPPHESMLQACHLAARAKAGDVETLNEYKQRFATDQETGFVPMFNIKMFERAIEIAHSTA